jgi:predicted alpha/beta-hydrolase family hydrolase
MSDSRKWKIDVGTDTTSAAWDPGTDDGTVFVCAHGAGGNMSDRSILALSKALNKEGVGVVRFNFLYKEKGSGRPDPMPRLESTFAAVVEHVRGELSPKRVIIGGRSMGGRAGSMLASKGFDSDGLLLLAYPLHPPGQPEKLRTAHLASIRVPVLCFNGTRDTFCTPALMEKALETVQTQWDMRWLEAADHSFHVPKSSGRTDAQVLDEVAATVREWIGKLA